MEISLDLARAICQEFSDEVSCLYQYNIADSSAEARWGGELRCVLPDKYFGALLERLLAAGYCCTQVQKDARKGRCTAWFEPSSKD